MRIPAFKLPPPLTNCAPALQTNPTPSTDCFSARTRLPPNRHRSIVESHTDEVLHLSWSPHDARCISVRLRVERGARQHMGFCLEHCAPRVCTSWEGIQAITSICSNGGCCRRHDRRTEETRGSSPSHFGPNQCIEPREHPSISKYLRYRAEETRRYHAIQNCHRLIQRHETRTLEGLVHAILTL